MKRIVVSLTLPGLAYALMQMMIVPGLPAIQRDLGASPDAAAWIVSAFLLSTTIGIPILGRLGDAYGKQRVLIVVLLVFGVGGIVGALATSLTAVIVARVLQGLGGAVFPLAFGIARDVVRPARVPLAVGIISGSFGVGGTLGLVIGGPLVDRVSWSAIFWLGVVLPVVAIACVRLFVPPSPPRRTARLDWVGALLLAASVLPLLIAVARWRTWGGSSPAVLGSLLVAAVGLAALVRWELRHHDPLIDMRLLRQRPVWAVDVSALLVGFAMYANGFLVPQLVQADPTERGLGFGATVTATGLFLLPASVGNILASPMAGWLGGRLGSRLVLAAGTATMAAGFALLAAGHAWPFAVYVGVALSHGIGLSLAYTALSNLVVAAVPATQTAAAGGVNTMMRTLGGAFGSQVAGALTGMSVMHGALGAAGGFVLAFGLCGALMLLGFGLAWTLPEGRRLPATAAVSGRSEYCIQDGHQAERVRHECRSGERSAPRTP